MNKLYNTESIILQDFFKSNISNVYKNIEFDISKESIEFFDNIAKDISKEFTVSLLYYNFKEDKITVSEQGSNTLTYSQINQLIELSKDIKKYNDFFNLHYSMSKKFDFLKK